MEMWDPDEKPNLTWSHPWAASPGFIIAWLLFGLRCVAPGCAEVEVRPAVGSLTHGAYELPTIKGPLGCSFARDGATLDLTVSLPAGVAASVALPRRDGAAALLVDGAPWARVRAEDAHLVAVGIGAGEHTVSVAVAA